MSVKSLLVHLLRLNKQERKLTIHHDCLTRYTEPSFRSHTSHGSHWMIEMEEVMLYLEQI
jgi:hypothetical protein